jgi:hypothetical protein
MSEVNGLPVANEPQDVATVGPTPYKDLFGETAKRAKVTVTSFKKELGVK